MSPKFTEIHGHFANGEVHKIALCGFTGTLTLFV